VPTIADSSFALLGIGGAHVDRIGHVEGRYHPGASNPGHLTSSVGGGALNALRNARLRDVGPIGLISARGGDHDGAIVGDTIDKAGIADMSAVFLDRRTASYTAILETGGDQVAGLADMDIYETALPRQLRRKALRDAVTSANALLVDANLPVAALQTVCDLAAGPVPAEILARQPIITYADGSLQNVMIREWFKVNTGYVATLRHNLYGEFERAREAALRSPRTFALFLQRRTRQDPETIARRIGDVSWELLAQVSRYPALVPRPVREELASRIARHWPIPAAESLRAIETSEPMPRAASRRHPYPPPPSTFEELLGSSSLTARQRSLWAEVAGA